MEFLIHSLFVKKSKDNGLRMIVCVVPSVGAPTNSEKSFEVSSILILRYKLTSANNFIEVWSLRFFLFSMIQDTWYFRLFPLRNVCASTTVPWTTDFTFMDMEYTYTIPSLFASLHSLFLCIRESGSCPSLLYMGLHCVSVCMFALVSSPLHFRTPAH